MVLFGHTEQIKGFHGFKCYFNEMPFLFQGGHLAVIFFFVLSGFLITYIIQTKLMTSGFSVSDFYKKRVIRIWPLYFFIIVLGLYVIPELSLMAHNSSWVDSLKDLSPKELREATIFFFLVLPNISMYYGVFEYLGHTWSIGVEEQFYLIWPLLMSWFRLKTTLLLFSILMLVWSLRFSSSMLDWNVISIFISVFKIDAMALGGLSAIMLLNHQWLKKYLVNSWVEIISITIVLVAYLSNTHFGAISDEVYSVLFSLIIVNAATNPTTIIRIERFKVLGYLGQVSYGIYMYHPITAMLSLLLFNFIHPSYMSSLTSNMAFYSLAFGITCFTAIVSFELVEKRIMNFGRRKWLSSEK